MTVNRQWTLARRPEGAIVASDFEQVASNFEPPELAKGEVLVRNAMFAIAPTIRNWLNAPGLGYRGSIPIGGVIVGMAGCVVIASAHSDYPEGTRMVAMARWEDFSVLRPDTSPIPVFSIPVDMSFEEALGAFSPNSLTAYFGLIDIGRPRAGETILVSGAAGSVGSVVCQIARLLGCMVIGIAGSADKCEWLHSVCGVDATIDYRTQNVPTRLAELAPDGIDVFFDNVGGDILNAVIDRMAPHGRIVLCGQISAYDREGSAPGPRDMMKLVYGSIRMQGFVVGTYIDRIDAARAQLRTWIDEGSLIVRTDVRQGFDALPTAFVDLFSGRNDGTLLVAV